MSSKKARAKIIAHHMHMLDEALCALMEMNKLPDVPTDLSKVPLGALTILKKSCEVKLLFSGGNAFGIMDLTADEDSTNEKK